MIGFTAALRLTSLVSSLFLTQNISFFHQPLLRKRSVTVSGSARNNAWPCSLPPVLPIPGMLSLDWDLWPFFWDLGIFGKLWRCVKWNISVYFASHIWFYFSHLSFALRFFYAAVHYHSFRDFWYCSRDFHFGSCTDLWEPCLPLSKEEKDYSR